MRLPPSAVAIAACVAISMCMALTSCAPAAELTDEQLAAVMNLRAQHLADLAEGLGLDSQRDIPELVRWVEQDQLGAAIKDCLREAGIEPSEAEFVSNVTNGPQPDPRAEPIRIALWECNAKYSVDPRPHEALSDAQLATMYHYYDVDLRQCLEQRGFVVDPGPGLDEFIDTYDSSTPWPYDRVQRIEMREDSWEQINRDCPQEPPATELYGPPLPKA